MPAKSRSRSPVPSRVGVEIHSLYTDSHKSQERLLHIFPHPWELLGIPVTPFAYWGSAPAVCIMLVHNLEICSEKHQFVDLF